MDGQKGRPLRVIPVQVAQQQAAVEGLPAQQGWQTAQAGARVEDQRRRLPVRADRHARGVTAVADELGAGRRRGTAHAECSDLQALHRLGGDAGAIQSAVDAVELWQRRQ